MEIVLQWKIKSCLGKHVAKKNMSLLVTLA